jgi:hypothetical protein
MCILRIYPSYHKYEYYIISRERKKTEPSIFASKEIGLEVN